MSCVILIAFLLMPLRDLRDVPQWLPLQMVSKMYRFSRSSFGNTVPPRPVIWFHSGQPLAERICGIMNLFHENFLILAVYPQIPQFMCALSLRTGSGRPPIAWNSVSRPGRWLLFLPVLPLSILLTGNSTSRYPHWSAGMAWLVQRGIWCPWAPLRDWTIF